MIPALVKQGFRGQIFATEATAQLCGIMLMDSAHIQESEAQWRNRKAERAGQPPVEPVYTIADAQAALKLFHPCQYGPTYDVLDGVQIRFQDAGHLMGSASIYVTVVHALNRTERADRSLTGGGLLHCGCFTHPISV